MRILNRLVVVLVLAIAALPLVAAQALVAVNERYQKEEELHQALESAVSHYQSGLHYSSALRRSEREIEETEERLPVLARRKRETRLQLSAVRETLQAIKAEHGIDPADEEYMRELLADGEKQLQTFIRFLHIRNVTDGGEGGSALLRQYLLLSLGERTEQDMRNRAMLRARARFLNIIATAQQFQELEHTLRGEYEELAGEYLALLERNELAYQRLHASASNQAEIQRIVAEVQGEIMKMQSELARIDARIRRQSERDLIEKGIIETKEGAYNDGAIVGDPAGLSWPAVGRISAGFLDAAYRSFFGVPHKGIDIAVPQGTPIRCAADGVVFLARDGGQTGYSYILVGHRGGTATLYGHVSQIGVTTGQDVSRGQVLGLSGGTPGTYGAGPMTTGAHVHLEVIQNGGHIDPLLVLPAR
ncbi:hypothetical protein A2454_02345 [Candidatus Peribacteria bacterium RIFOXYC2_FULL_55_14]|nr:MAG: hypothetical protein A2198_05750 [Candidatus Peribacteria bacterium RIFOXYA1_FULL_56_14]OGJ74379.1 MAG: hypothetical protein A2384_06660 [Candidatus Peribacteria bacterium RIFOXYB1_FULL_54_35]OGJ75087.1 MAG: hypothetical protein A2217_05145 [Candidatus Peribacteria bacterium RIFOXYA2_FULL_55_28]OGJ75997.1 MAG: hypothetical protein A2327_03805 [Candidatus Peribacteria bacterium RIFOXYB2_FULL_54_17]OGJ77486.1 MAG: hypothetical protein A2424_03995 [Candidatus Peribacteria bacterium RIFOXYC